jgi:hypothetical protein
MSYFLMFLIFFISLISHQSFSFFQKRKGKTVNEQLRWSTIFFIIGGFLWMLIYDFVDNNEQAIIYIKINNIESLYEIGLKVLLKTIGGVFFIFVAAGFLCIPFILINSWLKKINQMNNDFDNLSVCILYFAISNVILSVFFLFFMNL